MMRIRRPPASSRRPRTGPRTARPTDTARRHPAARRRSSCRPARARAPDASAATSAAPHEIPDSMPSSRARPRAVAMASSLLTCSTRSTSDRSRFFGMKPAPRPWILCGAGVERLTRQGLTDDRRVGRLDRDGEDFLALGALDVARHAGERAAGADARHEHVDLALRVLPDLGSRRPFMNRGIGRIVELPHQHVLARIGRRQFLGLRDRALHALGARRQDQLGAEAISTLRRSMLIVSGMVSTQP